VSPEHATTASNGIVVTAVDLDDDAALDELLAFAGQNGRPRATTAVGYRELTFNTNARIGFVARRNGEPGLRAAALPTITAAIGLDQVQLNAFLALVDHPELEAGAEALWCIAHEDVPSALRFDSADLPTLRRELELADDDPMPSLVLVAVADDDQVVGLGVGLRRYADRPSVVGHRMNATARGWRGRGVAHALKVEQVRRAAREGVRLLEASNDSGNAPMQAINERLGYVPEYRLVLMRRAVD
jgi:GNAT superfamily N-acetyltransferase